LTIGLKELRYSGFVIGGRVLKTDPGKVEAIKSIPKRAKEVRRFIGTAGWYRRFVQNFAEMTAPLTDTRRLG